MKVVIAIDSFKESASSLELAKSIEEGIKRVYPKSHVVSIPVADGGEGTLEALGFGEKKETITLTCKDPLMRCFGCSFFNS
ncbi:MAG: glycerate kinase [Sulfurospirillum sp.]|nr:glycerate kinase [Sulfurospirillum sp.]